MSANSNFESLLERVKKLEIIVKKDEIFEGVMAFDENGEAIKDEAIKDSALLEKTKDEVANKDRLLKVGIIGRVKAGKSSFLNALLFNGESILPRAATPMTAALTELKFSQSPKIEAEFYTPDELKTIKEKAGEFEQKLKERQESIFAKLKENFAKKARPGEVPDEQKFRQDAKTSALRELKSEFEQLAACFEQQGKIAQAPLTQRELDAHKSKEIHGDLSEVREQLLNFVGESGKFMPYTESITLNLNNEFLKDVQIIDTPGLNDPMPSRSARTNKFLDKCDAVLVLSPAEQFLDASDVNLIAKLTGTSGTARIVFIASKADSELFGSEKDKANGDLNATFKGVANALEISKEKALRGFGIKGEVLQRALKERLIVASSVCASIVAKNARNLDETEEWILGRLKEEFPSEFTDDKMHENLTKLANVSALNAVFAELRKEKDELKQKHIEKFVQDKFKSFGYYKEALQAVVSERIAQLKGADKDELDKQIKVLEKARQKGTNTANDKWESLCDDLVNSLREKLYAKRDRFFNEFENKSESSKGRETESYKVKDNGPSNLWGLFGNRYKTETRTVDTINASAVRKFLKDTCEKLEDLLNDECESHIKAWCKGSNGAERALMDALRKEISDEHIDADAFRQSIRRVLGSISYPNKSYIPEIPSDIEGKSGMLKGYEAERFIESVFEFASDFKSKVREDIKEFMGDLKESLNVKVGDKIFEKLMGEIKAVQEQLKNQKLYLDRFTALEREVSNV